MAIRKQIDFLPHQVEFLEAKEKFVLLLAGLGGGKTFAGAAFTIKESLQDKDTPGLITANTYRQLQNATLNTLQMTCDKYDIDYSYNSQKGVVTVAGAKWFAYSLDSYNNLRGIEVGRFWGDEMCDADPEAFQVMMGRLRYGNNLKGRLTTTPSGYDYLYDYFAGDKKTPEFRMIHATSMDNTFLPSSYVETLKASYDSKIYEQEVLGKFVNIMSGRIYYGFDRAKHVRPKVEINPRHSIYVGMDFNINPMTACVLQYYDETLHVIDEYFIMTSNTKELGLEIRQKYGPVTVIPDSTGKRMQTSSGGVSDHQILRDLNFKVISTQNPFRVDRYNTVNNLFDKGRVVIDAKCSKLIKDLEQVSYKDGTSLPDTNDSTLTHLSDALGYAAYYLQPILPRKSEVRMIPR